MIIEDLLMLAKLVKILILRIILAKISRICKFIIITSLKHSRKIALIILSLKF